MSQKNGAVQSAEIVHALLRAGADPRDINCGRIRTLCALPSGGSNPLSQVTRKQYLAARHFRQGKRNPEDVTEPYKVAMILAGANAYIARSTFDDPANFTCRISFKQRPPQVWCFDRFGQSYTRLSDGRVVLIGGEHEDSYDPDFCIYNDVTVVETDGTIRIYGYPFKTFEPTDFHTATLIDDSIWIIGGIGYPDQRRGSIPVYRLSIDDFSIQRVRTTGAAIPRVFRQRATLQGKSIRIYDGQQNVESPRGPSSEAMTFSATFDTMSLTWTIES